MRGRSVGITSMLMVAACSQGLAQSRARLVAWTGGPTPLGGDSRYIDIGEASIDGGGRVHFTATVQVGALASMDVLVRGRADNLEVVARTGDPLPTMPGASFGGIHGTLVLTHDHSFAFAPYVSPGSVGAQGQGIVTFDGAAFLRPVLWSEMALGPTPDGPFVNQWSVRRFGGAQTSAVIATMFGGAAGYGTGVVMGSPDGVRVAARTQVALPGMSGDEVAETIDSNDLVVNGRGECVFRITSTPPSGTIQYSLWKGSLVHEVSVIVRQGDVVPGEPDWRISSIRRWSSNAAGDVAVAVQCSRPGQGVGDAVLVGGPGRWSVAAAVGRPAPGRAGTGGSPGVWTLVGSVQTANPTTLHLLNDGRVLFWGNVRDGSTVRTGFWMGPPDDVRLISLSGEVPIGGGGGPMLESFFNRPMHVNERGVVVFSAHLQGIPLASIAHIPEVGTVLLRANGWPMRDVAGNLWMGLSDYVGGSDQGSTGADGRLSRLSSTGEYVTTVGGSSHTGVLVGRVACLADWHYDGGVMVEDLLAYLDSYVGGSFEADIDDGVGVGRIDGGVTIDDLLYYLARYELGC